MKRAQIAKNIKSITALPIIIYIYKLKIQTRKIKKLKKANRVARVDIIYFYIFIIFLQTILIIVVDSVNKMVLSISFTLLSFYRLKKY